MSDRQKPADPLAAIDATIMQLERLEGWADSLRATAPAFVAGLGDLNRRLRPTAIGFVVDVTVDEWAAMAAEHQRRFEV